MVEQCKHGSLGRCILCVRESGVLGEITDVKENCSYRQFDTERLGRHDLEDLPEQDGQLGKF